MFHIPVILCIAALLSTGSLISGSGISLADDYKKNSALQWGWAIDSLANFSFSPNDKVLDIGCGDGKITAFIAGQLSQGIVIGLDISEKMLAQASSLFDYGNLLFLQGDARAIPFKKQFDKLVSFCTLHWLLDQDKALESMKESLKPGGTMLLVLAGKAASNAGTIEKMVAQSHKWAPYLPNYKPEKSYYTPEEYKKLLEEKNFTIQSLKVTENWAFYPNKEALIAWIKPLITFIDHLKPALQALFIEDVANKMLEREPPLSDGSISLRYVKIEVIAQSPK